MIYNLQLLRALAALLVVTHHLNRVLSPVGLGEAWYAPGASGVDLFFVISGFVMVHTMANKPVGAGAFLLNRIIRVVPMYWIFTILLAIACWIVPTLFTTTRAPLYAVVNSLLFIPYPAPAGANSPVLFVGWTLNYEILFYLLFAASILAIGRQVVRIAALTIAALMMLVVAGGIIQPSPLTVVGFFTDSIMLEFGMGMMLAFAWRNHLMLARNWAWLLLVLGLASLLGMTLVTPLDVRGIALGVPAMVIVAAALSLEHHGVRWRGRLGQLLGASSYALYLSHIFVVMAVAKISIWLDDVAMAWLLALVSLFLSCLVGVAVHAMLERPLTDRLRRLIRHRPMVIEAIDPSA